MLATLCAAWATTYEELHARLAEVEAVRPLRLQKTSNRPSEADQRKIVSGAVLAGLLDSNEGNRAYGYAVVPISIASMWAALNDETRHPGYTPVTYSELLSGRPCASGRRVLQFLPVPFLSDRWWIGILTKNQPIMQTSGGSVRELQWKSSVDPAEVTSASGQKIIAQGVPIGYTRGAWLLVALSERDTYVEYYLHSDPGAGIPSSMASNFVAKGVRDAIAAIQQFAREGHPACPIE